jgi:hypothetical protein
MGSLRAGDGPEVWGVTVRSRGWKLVSDARPSPVVQVAAMVQPPGR